MTMTAPPVEIIEAVGELLATCGPTFIGLENMADNDSPPRYAWAPIDDEPDSDFDVGANPVAVAGVRATFAVHCWGKSYIHAWRLRQALITALHDTVNASFRIGSARWTPGSVGTYGYIVQQTVSVQIPIVEVAYPGALGDDIADDVTLTGQAKYAAFDTDGESDSDGILVAPNK